MLNQRQEMYALLLYQGVNQNKAYVDAGFASGTEMTVAANASRLANSDKIIARITELRAPAVERIASTKEAKLKVLEKIYTHEPDSDTITGMVVTRAIAEHNKMAGDYAPEKHAVLGDIVIEIVHKDK